MVVASGRDGVLFILIAGVILAGAAPVHASSAAPTPGDAADGAFAGNPPPAFATTGPPAPENNSSVRHERRDRLDETGDQTALKRWLASSLSSQLEGSFIQLEQGEYERARSLLGDSYRKDLGKYVEVAGNTDDESDDQAGEEFDEAQDQQDEYVTAVQQYRTTYREYEEAKRAGNETRARELARDLNDLQARIQQTGANLTASYDTLSSITAVDLSQANQTVTNTTGNITAQQREVRHATFTNTTLTITQRTATASFLKPVRLHGKLTAANGTRLADRQIVVRLSERTVRTRTTANGSFRVSLRPTLLPLGRQPVLIRYVPRASAVYLGTNTTVPVNIIQTTPTVSLSRTPSTVAFNETVAVDGRVHAANVSAGGVPVQVAIGDTVLETTRTRANGRFTVRTPLPADVPAGEQSVHVTLPLADQALAPANASATVTVTSTPTQLSVTQPNTTDEPTTVTLQGTLTTLAGAAVAEESIQVRVANRTVATATTNQTGQYTVEVAADALAAALAPNNTTVTVTAVYPGPGNLDPSRAQTRVEVPAPARDAALGGETGSGMATVWRWLPAPPWLIVGGVIALGILSGVVSRHFELGPWSHEATDATTATDSQAETPAEPQPTNSDTELPIGQPLYENARDHLVAGQTDTAVQAAYAAVRQQTTDALEWDAQDAATQTYWEFYYACRAHEAITDTQATALKQLTDDYEHAQFTSTATAADRATAAIDTAAEVLETVEPPAAAHNSEETPPTSSK
jgi:hypothetical protein